MLSDKAGTEGGKKQTIVYNDKCWFAPSSETTSGVTSYGDVFFFFLFLKSMEHHHQTVISPSVGETSVSLRIVLNE